MSLPLHVRLFDSTTIVVETPAQTTCRHFKNLIAEQTGLNDTFFLLSYNGDTVNDDELLIEDRGLSADDELVMEMTEVEKARVELSKLGIIPKAGKNTKEWLASLLEKEQKKIRFSHGGDSVTEVLRILVRYAKGFSNLDFLLHACATPDLYEVAKLYIQCGADVNKVTESRTPLSMACMHGCGADFIPLLLSAGADVNANNGRALFAAVRSDPSAVEILLNAGADPNLSPNLMTAFQRTNKMVAELLIAAGAVFKPEHLNTAVSAAVSDREGGKEFVEWLLSKDCVHLDTNNVTSPLHVAASVAKGTPFLLLLLNKFPNSISTVDQQHRTPLYVSCEQEEPESCTALLQHGADPNICTSDTHRSPLFISCYNGNVSIVRILLQHGADVNCQDHHGRSSLHISCKRGYVECVKELISNGADVNATDRYNRTPLWIASKTSRYLIVKELLAACCDVNAADTDSTTPFAAVTTTH